MQREVLYGRIKKRENAKVYLEQRHLSGWERAARRHKNARNVAFVHNLKDHAAEHEESDVEEIVKGKKNDEDNDGHVDENPQENEVEERAKEEQAWKD